MVDLSGVSEDELRAALDEVDEKRPTQRLTAALAHKDGVNQTTIAGWYDVQRKTIYNWLTRFGAASGSESLAEAAKDAPREGRHRRLSDQQLDSLRDTLQQPPADAGHDAPAWTPALVKQHIADRWDVAYSKPSCRRLMKEAGLSYQTPRRGNAEADPDERDEFREKHQKNASRWTRP